MSRSFVFANLTLATALWAAISAAQTAPSSDSTSLSAQDPAMQTVTSSAPARTISAEELKKLLDSKAAVTVVDDAPVEAYEMAHVPGAINFPWVAQIKPPIDLPRNKLLVFYCPCTHDEDSTDMANRLREFGYNNTRVLEGGWYKWESLHYPVAGTGDTANAQITPPPGASPNTSGRAVGDVTPSFRVLDVTGKYKGEKTCYVCEYGNAPTIIAFFQDTSDQTADLIVKLNRLVEQKSPNDLKGVAVLLEGPASKPWLEKLAADKAIKIPLVVLQNGPQDLGVRLYHINPAVKNTILVNDQRQVFANFTNVNDGNFQKVADASTKMLGDE